MELREFEDILSNLFGWKSYGRSITAHSKWPYKLMICPPGEPRLTPEKRKEYKNILKSLLQDHRLKIQPYRNIYSKTDPSGFYFDLDARLIRYYDSPNDLLYIINTFDFSRDYLYFNKYKLKDSLAQYPNTKYQFNLYLPELLNIKKNLFINWTYENPLEVKE